MPTYIGATDDDLVEVLPEVFLIRRSYWLVVPRELIRLTRVRAITDALLEIVDTNPELTAGSAWGCCPSSNSEEQ
ncbi:DNA-binding transcriptional LysR family regulator [Rhodococcus sp. 27YEA15]